LYEGEEALPAFQPMDTTTINPNLQQDESHQSMQHSCDPEEQVHADGGVGEGGGSSRLEDQNLGTPKTTTDTDTYMPVSKRPAVVSSEEAQAQQQSGGQEAAQSVVEEQGSQTTLDGDVDNAVAEQQAAADVPAMEDIEALPNESPPPPPPPPPLPEQTGACQEKQTVQDKMVERRAEEHKAEELKDPNISLDQGGPQIQAEGKGAVGGPEDALLPSSSIISNDLEGGAASLQGLPDATWREKTVEKEENAGDQHGSQVSYHSSDSSSGFDAFGHF
jgi:hypothetical protein